MILHGLKWITNLLLVSLVPDQDYYWKFTPVKKSRPICRKVVIHRCQSQQHKMTCIPSELPASDFVFE